MCLNIDRMSNFWRTKQGLSIFDGAFRMLITDTTVLKQHRRVMNRIISAVCRGNKDATPTESSVGVSCALLFRSLYVSRVISK